MKEYKVQYMNNLPFDIYGIEIKRIPMHYQRDLKLVYVVSGNIILENGPCSYTLKEGSIFVVNDYNMHSMRGITTSNMAIILHLDSRFFSRYNKSISNCFFVTYKNPVDNIHLSELRNTMARIYSESVNAADGYEERCIGMCNSILDFLYDECQFFTYESGQFVNNPKANPTLKKKKRMRDLINFLYSNYQNPLSLKNLTEKYDLSKYYISHAVKTATGLSFQELLGYIRSEKSMLPLINSNAKISAIAKEVGFTTTEYYKKHFKFWYGKTPDEYRKEYLSKPANVIDNVNTTILNSSDLGAALNTELSHDFGLITDSIKYRCQFVNVDVSNNHVTKPKHLLPNLSCPLDMVINNSEEVVMALKDLNAKKLSITSKVPLSILPPEIDRVRRLGVTLKYETSKSGKTQKNYTFDTCYMACRLFNRDPINLQLFDENSASMAPISGKNGLITLSGTKKPSYYAYKLLAKLIGDIIKTGENYIISRYTENKYKNIWIAVYNNNNEISSFPKCDSANEARNFEFSYKIETEILFHLINISGLYRVTRYLLSGERSLLAALDRGSYINKKNVVPFPPPDYINWFTTPKTDTETVSAQDSMSIHVKLKGYSCELIRIESIY